MVLLFRLLIFCHGPLTDLIIMEAKNHLYYSKMFSIQAFYNDRDHNLFMFTSTVIPPPHKNSQRKLLIVFLR